MHNNATNKETRNHRKNEEDVCVCDVMIPTPQESQ